MSYGTAATTGSMRRFLARLPGGGADDDDDGKEDACGALAQKQRRTLS